MEVVKRVSCLASINSSSIFMTFLRSLFRRKPVSAFLEEREDRGKDGKSGLSESLGLTDLLGYGVGCTVGAGIYSQISIGAEAAGEQRGCMLCGMRRKNGM